MSLPFLERLLQILGQGGFSATYKYAVLLALIDLCVEAGEPPTSVTTVQLARRVAELYWPQVRPYEGGVVLWQNAGKQAEIARILADFRSAHPEVVSPPRVMPGDRSDWGGVLAAIEWVLVEWPLPRVQRVGGGEERFLYVIGWGENPSRAAFAAYQRGDGAAFDNRILFQPGAADALIALSSVLRPLLQQHWLAKVCAINRLEEARLEEFLFGARRKDLGSLQRPLRRLQDGRCFYCRAALTGKAQGRPLRALVTLPGRRPRQPGARPRGLQREQAALPGRPALRGRLGGAKPRPERRPRPSSPTTGTPRAGSCCTSRPATSRTPRVSSRRSETGSPAAAWPGASA